MSLYALTSQLIQNLAREHWGSKVQDDQGNWIDTGVQDVVDAIVNGLKNQNPIPLNGPLTLNAPAAGGPSIIINRIVPVIGDNSGGDSFNIQTNTGVIRFIDQNGNIEDVPGGNTNVTNVSIGGSGGGTGSGLTTSVTLITNCTVQVTSTGSGSINVTSCSGTVSLSITNNVIVTLTTVTLSFQGGLLVGIS